jgi:hypothetical protein
MNSAENTASIVETCLPKLHSNGRGADRMQNTFFVLLLLLFVFKELLPGNALIKSVTQHGKVVPVIN